MLVLCDKVHVFLRSPSSHVKKNCDIANGTALCPSSAFCVGQGFAHLRTSRASGGCSRHLWSPVACKGNFRPSAAMTHCMHTIALHKQTTHLVARKYMCATTHPPLFHTRTQIHRIYALTAHACACTHTCTRTQKPTCASCSRLATATGPLRGAAATAASRQLRASASRPAASHAALSSCSNSTSSRPRRRAHARAAHPLAAPSPAPSLRAQGQPVSGQPYRMVLLAQAQGASQLCRPCLTTPSSPCLLLCAALFTNMAAMLGRHVRGVASVRKASSPQTCQPCGLG